MHADIFHTIIRYPLSILLLISSVATERRHFSTESKAQYTFNQCSVNVDSSHYVPSFPVYYQTGPKWVLGHLNILTVLVSTPG